MVKKELPMRMYGSKPVPGSAHRTLTLTRRTGPQNGPGRV